MSTTGGIDFNASNLTGILVGSTRNLPLSVMVVNDDIDEDDELFAVLLEVVDAVNPHRVNLTERNISVLRIADDDSEYDLRVFADCSELMYAECIIPILIHFLSTSPISLFLLPSHFYPYSLSPDIVLSFEQSSYTVSESQVGLGLPVNIVKEPIDAETEITYDFSVRATEVTATAGEDFTIGEDEQIGLSITPLEQQKGFLVVILDDARIEGIETFELELFVAEQPHFLLGSITRVTVTITDDDRREDEGREGREGGRREGKEGEEEG